MKLKYISNKRLWFPTIGGGGTTLPMEGSDNIIDVSEHVAGYLLKMKNGSTLKLFEKVENKKKKDVINTVVPVKIIGGEGGIDGSR